MKLVNPEENLVDLKISSWIREFRLPRGVFIIHQYNVQRQKDIIMIQTMNCDATMSVNAKKAKKFKIKAVIEKNIEMLLEMEKNIADSNNTDRTNKA